MTGVAPHCLSMNPVQKALWLVESNLRGTLSLDEVAHACHVSPFHLTRAFAAATGLSLMRYFRARRLTEAARALVNGADDILTLALDTGYGSHEAFTRAFRDQFGLTPEQVRREGPLANFPFTPPLVMPSPPASDLSAPRFETLPSRRLAGLLQRYPCASPAGIPDQWRRFAPHLESLPNLNPPMAYGACYDFDADGWFNYLCSVEVQADAAVPPGLDTLSLDEQRYAVFAHRGHVAGIRGTMTAIWDQWLPPSGCEPAEAPTLERYGPEFNPATGLGGFEIWIPLKS